MRELARCSPSLSTPHSCLFSEQRLRLATARDVGLSAGVSHPAFVIASHVRGQQSAAPHRITVR